MSDQTIQDILSQVQMPSRYIGNEINCIRKSWDRTTLHVALAFPDLYEIGTSHFGIQLLYGILNEKEDIVAERVFAPALDMEQQLTNNGVSLFSLESQTPLHRFDIVGFSLLYELNYTNMVNMLHLSKIPFFSHQRSETAPFVIAGGPCTSNPEPVADFFDAIVIGDGEEVVLQMTDAWFSWQKRENRKRKDLLHKWSSIKGVYIPGFYNLISNDGWKLVPTDPAAPSKIEKVLVADLNKAPFAKKPVVPFGRPVHDRLRMEIARGCTRGCRFCQAGMIYRPVRERHPEAIMDSVKRLLSETGYEDLSLLSLSTGDYSCIVPLMKGIMSFGERDHVAVSLPSLRAGSLTPELMELIKKVRKTGFTIAPEAGSQRLRDVINKNITEADIIRTVTDAFSLGWKVIKLYFMIGLPTETKEDIEAIVDLVKKLKNQTTRYGKRATINVSVATFVPKPHTPFQWEPQISLEEATEKIEWLKDNVKMSGVKVKWQDPKVSVVEGVFSRGDRMLRKVLVDAWEKGCRFDGWSDYFKYETWIRVLSENGIEPESYNNCNSDPGASLPWDHIHMGVDRSFLQQERERAIRQERTDDCRTGRCAGCGICDFDAVRPISFHEQKGFVSLPVTTDDSSKTGSSFKYLINYKKVGLARFLGHLEMTKVFTRCLRRERLPLQYSKGYHPMPKISFKDTLPLGMQSEAEQMLIGLTRQVDPMSLCRCLTGQLPDGLEIVGCTPYVREISLNRNIEQEYHVELKDGFFTEKDLDWFLRQENVPIERKRKKGKKGVVDLKKAVVRIRLIDNRRLSITLGLHDQLTVRPAHVMKSVFHLDDQQILTAVITKRNSSHV